VRVNDRGPYARSRIIDVSIGTAKALGFYGSGTAPVRVEYVGRAPLEGTDDTMLMATLREGNPAPAPSRIMVASAKPFLSDPGSPRVREPEPVAPERVRASASPQLVLQAPEPAARGQARSAVRLPDSARPDIRIAQERPSSANSAAASDPIAGLIRADPALGLMSGRGLY
jgi:rare lipoprotein A